MSEIAKSIIDLKNKLEDLEKAHNTKLENFNKRMKNYESLKEKYDQLKSIQGDSVTFNVGGNKFSINKQLVVSSIYDNVLKDILNNLEKVGKPVTDSHKIFIDRNPLSFKYIADILRLSHDAYIKSNLDVDLISNIVLNIDCKQSNPSAFVEDVKFYFKESSEKVLNHFVFKDFNGDEISLNVTSKVVDSNISKVTVSNNFPSDQLNPYRAKTYTDISKKTSKKGFFINYDSNIIFELSNSFSVSKIEIKPFSANLDYWVPCEGANSFVFSSTTGIDGETNWDFCCSLPDDYGLEWEDNKTYTLNFDAREAKFIKIQTGDYTLSVSYIKIG